MIVLRRALCSCLLATAAAAADDVRQELSLNGTWEQQLVSELTAPPTAGVWKSCPVPGYLQGTDYQRAWLRRSFVVPAAMRGQRIKLHFGGVKYHSRVLLNGRHVGGCFGGYEPFEVDVTGVIRFDGPNELVVGCHDWTGVFTPGKVEFPQGANWDAVRSAPRDKILSPIGGLYGLYGIWDDVTLRATPAVHVQRPVHPAVGSPRRAGRGLHAGQRIARRTPTWNSARRSRIKVRTCSPCRRPRPRSPPARRPPSRSGRRGPSRRCGRTRPAPAAAAHHAVQRRSAADAVRLPGILGRGPQVLPERRADQPAGDVVVAAARHHERETRSARRGKRSSGWAAWPFARTRSPGRACTTRWPTRSAC